MRLIANKPGKITPKMQSAQTAFSYAVFPFTIAMLLVTIGIVAFLVSQEINQQSAIYWLIPALAVIIARIACYVLYKRIPEPSEQQALRWRYMFLIGAFATAILLCAAGLLFFPSFSVSSKMVYIVVVIGIISAAMPVLATNMRAYLIYSGLTIAPIVITNINNNDIAMRLIGVLILVFFGMLMVAAYLFNRALLDSLIYRYRSELLADRLQIANNRLSATNQELQRISTVDELTGVYNRRYFNQRFVEVWADHLREQHSLAALMIDVDHFKTYNDHFGHLQGDNCLKKIAKEIVGVIRRPRDFVARFGGEEFIMLLPNTDIQGAEEIAARIHSCVHRLAMPHTRDDDIDIVTVSIGGAAVIPSQEYTSDHFLSTIDQALYAAKNSGRNRSTFL